MLKACVLYYCPEVWNSLPAELKSSQSLDVFKYKYKEILLRMYMYQVP